MSAVSVVTDAFLLLLVILSLAVVIAAVQYFQLFILRRWSRQITPPDPSFYAERTSYANGRDLRFFVHSSKAFVLRLYRVSYPENELLFESRHPAVVQSRQFHYWTGCTWDRPISVRSEKVTPGFYLVEVEQEESGARFRGCVLVKAESAKIAVVASTNTWQAYNSYAGLSNYSQAAIPPPLKPLIAFARFLNWKIRIGDRHYVPVVPLPKHRPNIRLDEDFASVDLAKWESFALAGFSHLARSETHLIRLLEKVAADYCVMSDEDFARYGTEGAGASALIFNTHSEYWSNDMLAQLSIAFLNGLGIVFFSGNNMYRTVEIVNHSINVIDQRNERDQQAKFTGLAYDERGAGTFADYEVLSPDHPFFSGLDLLRGDLLADENYDGSARASGHETDKVWLSDGPIKVLAVGTNDDGPAVMIYKTFANGGWLLNVGSVSFVQTIHQDRKITKFSENVIAALLNRSSNCLILAILATFEISMPIAF